MTKLTDGKKTVDIEMMVWEGNGYTPDWSKDFFEVGNLEYDEKLEAYKVRDVDYCIEQASDWRKSIGDFSDCEPNENNTVFVDGEVLND